MTPKVVDQSILDMSVIQTNIVELKIEFKGQKYNARVTVKKEDGCDWTVEESHFEPTLLGTSLDDKVKLLSAAVKAAKIECNGNSKSS